MRITTAVPSPKKISAQKKRRKKTEDICDKSRGMFFFFFLLALMHFPSCCRLQLISQKKKERRGNGKCSLPPASLLYTTFISQHRRGGENLCGKRRFPDFQRGIEQQFPILRNTESSRHLAHRPVLEYVLMPEIGTKTFHLPHKYTTVFEFVCH